MNDMVTIPREEYERLIAIAEDHADAAAVVDFRRKLDAGEEELIPSEFANRLIDGEPPLRVFRELRGLSQQALAKASGVNRVQIGDIEDRGKTGSVATLRKLADALSVQIDDLA